MIKFHWFCKFMRRGFEPPMPFGKSSTVLAAESRKEAIEILNASNMVSPQYPKVTASKTDKPVSYEFKFTENN